MHSILFCTTNIYHATQFRAQLLRPPRHLIHGQHWCMVNNTDIKKFLPVQPRHGSLFFWNNLNGYYPQQNTVPSHRSPWGRLYDTRAPQGMLSVMESTLRDDWPTGSVYHPGIDEAGTPFYEEQRSKHLPLYVNSRLWLFLTDHRKEF